MKSSSITHTTRTWRMAKTLLYITVLLLFVPLVMLAFYNHASADDLMCAILLRKHGFAGYQWYTYQFWGGRYTATFLGSAYAGNGFLYSHYYLHSLVLLALNVACNALLLYTIQRRLFNSAAYSKFFVPLLLIYTTLEMVCLAQPSTYIYWFSSAVTYQIPVILLKCEIALLLALAFNLRQGVQIFYGIAVLVLTVVINGFNELFVVMQFFLLLLLWQTGWFKKYKKAFWWLWLLLFVISALAVLLSPGIRSRATNVVPKSIAVGLMVWVYQVANVLWNIVRQPLFILCFLSALLAGNSAQTLLKESRFLHIFIQKKWKLPLFTLAFIAACTGLAVAGLKGGIIPARYVNAVNTIVAGLLLLNGFTLGMQLKRVLALNASSLIVPLLLVFCVFVCTSDLFLQAYKSLISAPVYNEVLDQREQALRAAAKQHTAVVIKRYDTAVQELINKKYGHAPATWLELVSGTPALLFVNDDAELEVQYPALKEFYQADSVIIK